MKKKYRENQKDLNRHIPQEINEFASLALAGRYPYLFIYLFLTVNVGTGSLVINCFLYQVNDLKQRAPFAGY